MFMNIMIAVFVFLFGVALISSAPTDVQQDLGNTYGPSIAEGNCTLTPDQDLLFSDHIQKNRIPFLTRSATTTYYGDTPIYCIRAMNQKVDEDKERAGNANITKGGIGHNYATIEMLSYINHGIEFIIKIYGK